MIHILIEHIDYEGSNIVGVYDDMERAKLHARNQINQRCNEKDRCTVPDDFEYHLESHHLNEPEMGSHTQRLVYPWGRWT